MRLAFSDHMAVCAHRFYDGIKSTLEFMCQRFVHHHTVSIDRKVLSNPTLEVFLEMPDTLLVHLAVCPVGRDLREGFGRFTGSQLGRTKGGQLSEITGEEPCILQWGRENTPSRTTGIPWRRLDPANGSVS